jgi:hypothetical protein
MARGVQVHRGFSQRKLDAAFAEFIREASDELETAVRTEGDCLMSNSSTPIFSARCR